MNWLPRLPRKDMSQTPFGLSTFARRQQAITGCSKSAGSVSLTCTLAIRTTQSRQSQKSLNPFGMVPIQASKMNPFNDCWEEVL